MTIRSQKVTFEGAQGDTLAARLDLPAGPVQATALFAHCFTCSKDVFAASRIAAGLAGRGIAVLRFDFTGLGASEGEFANTNFSSNVADLVAAADHLRRTHQAPQLLVGHSLGGAAALAAAGRIEEVRAVATIGAPSDPGHVRHLLKDDLARIARDGAAEVTLAGRSFRITRQFVEDVAGQKLAEAIGRLRRALLVLHAPRDELVGIDNAGEIFAAAKHPKSFVSLDDADHLLTRKADAEYAAEIIAAWASRYLDEPEPAALATDEDAVTVAENGIGKLSQDVFAGAHMLHADEPRAAGGDDTGPTPYQLLSAALGACTVMTMRLYADRKGWDLRRSAVRISHDKIHAADCADCETREGRIDKFVREITLEGDLDDEARQRLLEIADKCPVHRTLHSEVSVETRLAEPQAQ